jgi:NAD(P)-dependent dehydrogenase (short-subunit alcohol dehydrogenase family)
VATSSGRDIPRVQAHERREDAGGAPGRDIRIRGRRHGRAAPIAGSGLPAPAGPAQTPARGKAAELLTIQTDLTTDSAADEITEAARAGFGRIDILANNAGIGPGSIRPDSWQRPLKFWEITPDQWRRFVAVHTSAPLALGERRRARDDDRRPSQGDRGFESTSLQQGVRKRTVRHLGISVIDSAPAASLVRPPRWSSSSER